MVEADERVDGAVRELLEKRCDKACMGMERESRRGRPVSTFSEMRVWIKV